MDVRIGLLAGLPGQLHHALVRLEFPEAHLGHLTGLVAENRGVHVVVQDVPGYEDVADVQLRVQGARHAGIDHMGHLKHVRQNLHAQRRVHLADAAADDNYGYVAQRALEEVHPGLLYHRFHGHFLLKLFYLQLHRSYDAYLRHIMFSLSKRNPFISIRINQPIVVNPAEHIVQIPLGQEVRHGQIHVQVVAAVLRGSPGHFAPEIPNKLVHLCNQGQDVP